MLIIDDKKTLNYSFKSKQTITFKSNANSFYKSFKLKMKCPLKIKYKMFLFNYQNLHYHLLQILPMLLHSHYYPLHYYYPHSMEVVVGFVVVDHQEVVQVVPPEH